MHGENQRFKDEIIDDLACAKQGEKSVSIYRQGDFTDLCRGPHVPNTGKKIKAFKLLSVTSKYWHGDSNREQLTRIYGTAFFSTVPSSRQHLKLLEEAKKRDHRNLGPRARAVPHAKRKRTGQRVLARPRVDAVPHHQELRPRPHPAAARLHRGEDPAASMLTARSGGTVGALGEVPRRDVHDRDREAGRSRSSR